MKTVTFTILGTIEIEDGTSLEEAAKDIKHHGLGPEDAVAIEKIQLQHGIEDYTL